MGVESLLWSEAHRPKKIADCILPPRLKDYFQAMVDKGELQNMTLIGGAGTGKTTVAKALCDELGFDWILINASEDGNIDTIRSTVRSFGSTVSLTSKMKCIILDEGDYLNRNSAQPALRGVIEEFEPNCRFIITGNFGNKIIDPLLSRCPLVDFHFTKAERGDLMLAFMKRMKTILKAHEVEFDTDQLVEIAKKNFPDFRKTLNLLQRFSTSGRLELTNINSLSDDALKALMAMLKGKDFGKMRKWVTENLDNDGVAIRRSIYDKAFDYLQPSSIPEMVLLLAQYDYKESFVADREINIVAMLTEMMGNLEFKE